MTRQFNSLARGLLSILAMLARDTYFSKHREQRFQKSGVGCHEELRRIAAFLDLDFWGVRSRGRIHSGCRD